MTPEKDDLGGVLRTIILLFALAFPLQVRSQGLEFWNAADRATPHTAAINPAILAFHHTQIAAGLRVFQLGFLEDNAFALRENRLGLSLPWLLPAGIGIGFDVRYYEAGGYTELGAAALMSKRFGSSFSIGFKAAVEQRGFDRDTFEGVAPGDPLLTGGLTYSRLNTGLGAYWSPGPLRFGVGIDHLNQADIGILNGGTILPREYYAAAGFQVAGASPTLLLHYDGSSLRMGFALTAANPSLGSLRIGYERELPIRVEAALFLTRNDRLHYGMDLPGQGTRGISAGTQQLDYVRILGREPELGQPEILFSETDLKIIKRTVLRSMESGLEAANLAAFDEILPEYVSTGRHRNAVMIVVAGALSRFETDSLRSHRYGQIYARAAEVVEQNPMTAVVIRADENSMADARAIRTLLLRDPRFQQERVKISGYQPADQPSLSGFLSGKTTRQRNRRRSAPEELVMTLAVAGKSRKTNGWRLAIINSNKKIVRLFHGGGKLPDTVSWDLKDRRGRLVAPGPYTAVLEAKTAYGRKRRSRSTGLSVVHVDRTVHLRFRNAPALQTSRPVPDRQTAGVSRVPD